MLTAVKILLTATAVFSAVFTPVGVATLPMALESIWGDADGDD